jgi:hypothetical protein
MGGMPSLRSSVGMVLYELTRRVPLLTCPAVRPTRLSCTPSSPFAKIRRSRPSDIWKRSTPHLVSRCHHLWY